MSREVTIELGPDEALDEAALRSGVARALRCSVTSLGQLAIVRRSIDARRGGVRFRLVVAIDPPLAAEPSPLPQVRGERRVIIVGDGPAGLFCAHALAKAEIPSIVLDRGHPVQRRRRDLKKLNQDGVVDSDSNYCFGEGGAGTYSDGKLYTRAGKRGDIGGVLATLVGAGAPEDIRVDARPHIGSNKLPKVVTALREQLEAAGVEFRFEAKVVGLEREGGHVRGVTLADGDVISGEAVVLATGHSARDIYTMLEAAEIKLEQKSFALGVRIEHPQPLINEVQYGAYAAHPALPAASYRLACEVGERGVFSFCMCPGGWIVPAATEPGGVVVNGMSLSRRDSPFANSGIVVAIEPADLAAAGYHGPLAGIELQRAIERAAGDAGGGDLRAPATRLTDFLAGSLSQTVPGSSYIPGLAAADIGAVLDAGGLILSERLRAGLEVFCLRMRRFRTGEAVLVGVESRTSSPVRVPRAPDSLESPDLGGLYPCGEGAGYAGGIVSAALDGVRVAAAIAARW